MVKREGMRKREGKERKNERGEKNCQVKTWIEY